MTPEEAAMTLAMLTFNDAERLALPEYQEWKRNLTLVAERRDVMGMAQMKLVAQEDKRGIYAMPPAAARKALGMLSIAEYVGSFQHHPNGQPPSHRAMVDLYQFRLAALADVAAAHFRRYKADWERHRGTVEEQYALAHEFD